MASNEPPPGAYLGVDKAGSGAGDGFGLVGRPGGRDLLATGGSAFTWYAGLLKDELQNRLTSDKRIRSGSYSVVVRVWVRSDGVVEKANIQGSSGDSDRDRVIESVLSGLTRLTQAPPADMPHPSVCASFRGPEYFAHLPWTSYMHRTSLMSRTVAVFVLLACAANANAAASAEESRSLNELRDTVVNLLQGWSIAAC